LIRYTSSAFGTLDLSLSDPTSNDDRLLFAHYQWNSGLWLAELVGRAFLAAEAEAEAKAEVEPKNATWTVTGQHVLELGAGA
jgi:hypothetical protein